MLNKYDIIDMIFCFFVCQFGISAFVKADELFRPFGAGDCF